MAKQACYECGYVNDIEEKREETWQADCSECGAYIFTIVGLKHIEDRDQPFWMRRYRLEVSQIV